MKVNSWSHHITLGDRIVHNRTVKHCPFCGTQPEVTSHSSYNEVLNTTGLGFVKITCPKCRASMGAWKDKNDSYISTLDKVVCRWNNRVSFE
jgi:endogenous inhibitor of DNA gyrase (YacG/DUF329 family)